MINVENLNTDSATDALLSAPTNPPLVKPEIKEEDSAWDKARGYCTTATLEVKIDPENYAHMNPETLAKIAKAVWPPCTQGIPENVGYYWVMDLALNQPLPTLCFVNDGKVWTFGGARIPNPQADKMWFQGGIVPPFPTRDYQRDGRYFTQALPGKS